MSKMFKNAVREAVEAGMSSQERIWGRSRRQGGGACPSMFDIGGFLDGTMAAKPDRKAMEEHLAECAVCRSEIVDLYLLLRAQRYPTPPDLMQRLLGLCPDYSGKACPALG